LAEKEDKSSSSFVKEEDKKYKIFGFDNKSDYELMRYFNSIGNTSLGYQDFGMEEEFG